MTISAELQKILNKITDANGRTAITLALNNSPALQATYNNLAIGANGAVLLKEIDYSPNVTDTTGSFNRSDGKLHTGLGWLTTNPGYLTIDADKLTYLMGHEGQHAAYGSTMAVADASFRIGVNTVAASGGTAPHDYTATVLANRQASSGR